MQNKYKNQFILAKEEGNKISSILCEVFDKKNLDISWAFREEPPRFCGLISEVLDYQESDQELILKLRLPSIKAQKTPPSKSLGYCVIIGKIKEK